MIDPLSIAVFVILFILFVALGFYGSRWRKGDLSKLKEWGMAGGRLGTTLGWFLLGADIYTAYTFIAVPSSLFAKGAIYFFAAPYVIITYAFAMWAMPKFWKIANKHGYLTMADFVRAKEEPSQGCAEPSSGHSPFRELAQVPFSPSAPIES